MLKCLLLYIVIVLLGVVQSVDRSKFRTCADTGFCRKYRDKEGPIYDKNYELDSKSVRKVENSLIGRIITPNTNDNLNLRILVTSSGSVRVKITEDTDRWQPTELLMPDGLVPGKFDILEDKDQRIPTSCRQSKDILAIAFGNSKEEGTPSVLVVHSNPLKFELYYQDTLQISANDRSLMHYEEKKHHGHRQTSIENDVKVDKHGGKEVIDYGEDGLAIYADGSKQEKEEHNNILNEEDIVHGESFGGHKDSMPNGPISVGMDFSFPYAENVYGIPEHTSPLSLPTSKISSAGRQSHYKEPYRLYNLDVFEYELDNTMALYGHIPLMLAHGLVNGKGRTTGIFWFNPSETFIDISDGGDSENTHKESHWMSESGEIDFFLLPGPTPTAVYDQYTRLTGRQQLPPMFSLGYHQCRWNYRDEKDVAAVEGMFEQLDYPVDVIWLDIEHTDGKRYFTWDKLVFPNPIEMQKNVSKHGRKMVTIVDPHIKRDNNYGIHTEATQKQLYIKAPDGNADFDGWCWPGSSSYLDFTSKIVRDWWAGRFSLDKYIGSTMDLFTWNDMNEPSVFNGPEVSMPKDAKNLAGVEHREWHNLYGLFMQQATQQGLIVRSPDSSNDPTLKQRPFVLTRAFWAGSQRFGAMWTGDNTATWGHLKIAAPMLLSINLAGLSFAGADVGGFFGEPGNELFTRWYQAGSFTPFFRGHAHHDTKRREPWVFGEPYTTILRNAAMVRYSLLPLWYTTFYKAYTEGTPVMRTMFTEFPDDLATFKLDDQWMVGSTLLVKPVTDINKNSVDVYLPGPNAWFDLTTLKKYSPSSPSSKTNVEAPLDKIPVFIRGGEILSRKMRLRRSSKLMFFDPYTITIAPDNAGNAVGSLYLDDEISLAHETNHYYAYRSFSYSNDVLRCSKALGSIGDDTYDPMNTIERIEIAGQNRIPKRVVLKDNNNNETPVMFFHDPTMKIITLKKPDVRVVDNWTISLEF